MFLVSSLSSVENQAIKLLLLTHCALASGGEVKNTSHFISIHTYTIVYLKTEIGFQCLGMQSNPAGGMGGNPFFIDIF